MSVVIREEEEDEEDIVRTDELMVSVLSDEEGVKVIE